MSQSFSVSALRAQFPVLQQSCNGHALVYLDSAATTQKPQSVIDAMNNYYQYNNANVHRAAHCLSAKATQAFEQVRDEVRSFINAPKREEVIWTKGATEAINLVAQSYGALLEAGDEIIISTMEHHANIVPWQLLAQQLKLVLKVIPLTDIGELDLAAFSQLLTEKTRLVAVTHISNVLGTVNPIAEIVALSHQVGAKVLVDGSQAVAHLPIDVQALDCDFYVFSGHKMYGPTGIGVLYGKADLLNAMPVWQTGGEMIKKVSFSGTTFNALPFKFEPGTPNISGVIGLGAAVAFLQQQDRAALLHYEQGLFEYAKAQLSSLPDITLVGNAAQQAGVISFVVKGEHHSDIATLLDQQGVAIRAGHHCAMPLMESLGLGGTLRLSIACYNEQQDIDSFIIALNKTLEFL
ncbi:cysteine desulfurase [Motilimonas sp. 1_MG-2023]|uniref:aminotransferase class V-fold PLP-dependent enzyme n=1 Tax=Motilimonas sp. 1_MG-2023 TaxID=3062672 RepID=UPI0026E2E2DE|nr:cysteine desulfurase [Motilimonas sp. 1_MG-2023]MDO6527040.1 cysteine desulfurase [Motilimonas sp. 1_MG-2023]